MGLKERNNYDFQRKLPRSVQAWHGAIVLPDRGIGGSSDRESSVADSRRLQKRTKSVSRHVFTNTGSRVDTTIASNIEYWRCNRQHLHC